MHATVAHLEKHRGRYTPAQTYATRPNHLAFGTGTRIYVGQVLSGKKTAFAVPSDETPVSGYMHAKIFIMYMCAHVRREDTNQVERSLIHSRASGSGLRLHTHFLRKEVHK